jgi:uncharacterized membrane protein
MNRDWYKPAIWLMWVVLPATALSYWRNWDQLPMRMAVHFDANWQPNGYSSREGSLVLALGVSAFMLVVFTVAAYAVRVNKPSAALPVLVMFYLALGLLWFVNDWIVQRSLQGRDQRPHAVIVRSEFPHVCASQTGLTVLKLHL